MKEFSTLRPSLGSVVLVGGCFDVFHHGHLHFLQKAKKKGKVLVVALESDQFIRARKKKTPFHSQKQRAEILSAFTFIDYIVPLAYLKTDASYEKMVEKLRPSVIAVTRGDPYTSVKKKHAKKIGARVLSVTPHIKKFSSSILFNHAIVSRD